MEKLFDYFYGVNFLSEQIELNNNHAWVCYYIVEHTADIDLIRREAMKTVLLIDEQSHEFGFYGKQAQLWENTFDDVEIEMRPDADSDEIALTMVFHSLDEFVECLQTHISVGHFVPRDTYLMYDDEDIYEKVLGRLEY